jgi:hypothetical protein
LQVIQNLKKLFRKTFLLFLHTEEFDSIPKP